MEIKRNGSQPSQNGPVARFTGAVRIEPLFQPNGIQRAVGAAMTHIAIAEGVDWLEKVTDEQYSSTTKGERHAEAQTGSK
jgi:hypothetical protein